MRRRSMADRRRVGGAVRITSILQPMAGFVNSGLRARRESGDATSVGGFRRGDERERARGCGNGCAPGRPFCAFAADGGAIFASGNLISRSKNRRMSCGRISLLKNVQVHRNRECYDGNRETLACDMTSEEKQAQEFNSLRNIPDSFKKIVIVNGTQKPWRNDEGFVIMGMKYFLLNADGNRKRGM